jgi:hypothetical protein
MIATGKGFHNIEACETRTLAGLVNYIIARKKAKTIDKDAATFEHAGVQHGVAVRATMHNHPFANPTLSPRKKKRSTTKNQQLYLHRTWPN